MDKNQDAVKELLNSIKYMIQQAMLNTTKCYDGLVIKNSGSKIWTVRVNGVNREISFYGAGTPTVNSMVKVIVPQGNFNLAYFFI